MVELPGGVLHGGGERIGAIGERLLLGGGGGAVRALGLLGPLALLRGEVLRLLREIREVTLERSALEEFAAPLERFPQQPGTGENGSEVPFDSPSSARFLGTSLIVAQQSYFMGDPSHQAILDVEVGERGLPEVIPPNAGPIDNAALRITRIRFTGKRIRFKLSEKTRLFKAVARMRKPNGGRRHVSIKAYGYGPGRDSLPRLRARACSARIPRDAPHP
jgi:hypothetical protein